MNKFLFRLRLLLTLLMGLGLLQMARPPHVYADDQVVSDCGDTGLPEQLRAKLNRLKESGKDGTITFTCGPTIVLTEGVLPAMPAAVTIDGANSLTLSGNNASRLFTVSSGATLTLKNIIITKGYADSDGGAIYSNGTLNIDHCTFLDNQTTAAGNGGAILALGVLNIIDSEFADNQAASGGALYPTGAAAVTTITGSDFHDNKATGTTYGWGGALYLSAGAAVTINASTFNKNQAQLGGAIYSYQPSTQLTINASTVNENIASGLAAGNWHGGGIYNDLGTATLTNVTLAGNSATAGGGIYSSGTAILTNITLSDNTASDSGGGLYSSGTATLLNVTLSANSAAIGGGLFNAFQATLTNVTLSGNNGVGIISEGTVTLKNTLIAKGTEGKNCGGVSGGKFNLSDDASCDFAAGGGRDNVPDLLLGPLANNGGATLTHMPQPGSPAIDNGTGDGCPDTDQRGISRVGVGTACDVGAVEYEELPPSLYLPIIMR